jgi:hypothetical protein
MPTAGLTSSVKEVAIHTGRASGDRWLPWVVLNDGNFFKLDYTAAGFQWVYVPNGWGTAISSATVVGLGDTSLWKFNHTTGVFTHDTTWDKGVIRQMSGGWVIDGNGKGWHWE